MTRSDARANPAILVTGGTGSFGRQFVREARERLRPKRLVVFSRDEWKQSEMAAEYARSEFAPVEFVLGDVRDRDRLVSAMRGIDIVVHAAALKQLPAGEANPFEFVQTNVAGAENVVRAAERAGIEKLLLLSTDKAVQPESLYGASKLAAEKIFLAKGGSVLRLGNLLGSRGSVLSLFRRLIAEGAQSLPLTDERMTRFWMTVPQSVELVLAALDCMQAGEVFVPKLPSARVVDLASALAPGLAHHLIGIRPGEKLHEVLLTEEEAQRSIDGESWFIVLLSSRSKVSFLEPGFSYRSEHPGLQLGAQDLATLLKQAIGS